MEDSLFELIKSLTKNEKGYFKKFSSLHSLKRENNYIILFDALDKMKKYDEEKLIDHLDEYSTAKFLSKQKNYLRSLILKSIHSCYFESDIEIKLYGYLALVKILYHKGLLNECEKIISKAKKIIGRQFLPTHQVEFNLWENKIALVKMNIKKIGESKRKHLKGIEELTNFIQYIELYGDLYSVFMLTGNDVPKNKLGPFRKFSKNPLLKSEDRALSIQAKHYYHRILAIYYDTFLQYDKVNFHVTKRLELFRKNPATINLDPELYINTINNAVDNLISQKKYSKARTICKTLKESHFKTVFLNVRSRVRYYVEDFKISVLSLDFKRIIEESEEVNHFLNSNEKLIRKDERIQIHFFISYAYFAEGLYKDSLQWLNYILNNKDEIQEDFQIASRILNLVIHYELGNKDYLTYAVKSSYKYMKKKNYLISLEGSFLEFFKYMFIKHWREEELIMEFRILQKNIQKRMTSQENRASAYFNFSIWIESKIRKDSYKNLLKEKLKSA